MTKAEYAAYRQTPPWLNLVARLHVRAGGRCQGTRVVHPGTYHAYEQRCAETTRLQAHHLFYDRLGHEDLDDLILPCVHCHIVEHLVGVECARCGDAVIPRDDAHALVDDLGDELLAAPDAFETAFNEARWARSHWPFCDYCADLLDKDC